MKKIIKCMNCSREFETGTGYAKFCSAYCRNKHYNKVRREYLLSLGYNPNLPNGTRGAISELKVCCDLLEKGFEVFRSVSPHCSCDLAILKDGKLVRVEVRSNTYSAQKEPYNIKKLKKIKADVLAMVMPDKIIYEPDIQIQNDKRDDHPKIKS